MTDDQVDILARLTSCTELRLRVAPDHLLGVVTVDIEGFTPGLSAILAPNAAADLASRLRGAIIELLEVARDQPMPGAPGPFSARF